MDQKAKMNKHMTFHRSRARYAQGRAGFGREKVPGQAGPGRSERGQGKGDHRGLISLAASCL